MTSNMYQIVAMTESKGIGLNGDLPWSLKSELIYFSKITTKYGRLDPIHDPPNVVIMGRRTWESLPVKNRPLKNRINIIISSTMSISLENCFTCSDLTCTLELLSTINHSSVFIIGGASIYSQTLEMCSKLFITRIFVNLKCDTFYKGWDETLWTKLSRKETQETLFPIFSKEISNLQVQDSFNFEYQIWTKS